MFMGIESVGTQIECVCRDSAVFHVANRNADSYAESRQQQYLTRRPRRQSRHAANDTPATHAIPKPILRMAADASRRERLNGIAGIHAGGFTG